MQDREECDSVHREEWDRRDLRELLRRLPTARQRSELPSDNHDDAHCDLDDYHDDHSEQHDDE